MKYDCSDEFDLSEIFRKLTAPIAQTKATVSQEELSLAQFQRAINSLMALKQR